MTRARLRLALSGCLALLGCSRPGSVRTLQVERTAPVLTEAAAPVLLNDTLTVYFDEPLAPLSVTSDSVALVDAHGQQVPGALRSGANWVAFVPNPPLRASLDDGSFRPGATYKLVLAGGLRPDALRSRSDRRLPESLAFEVRVAARDHRPPGLPAPLRPEPSDLPFVLRESEGLQQLPADTPRVLLHFTRPLLPSSVTAVAFEVVLLDNPLITLVPRSVRLVPSRLDALPGCCVEIDLGAAPARTDGRSPRALQVGDWLSVALRSGPACVLDYSGNPPLPSTPQCWTVVSGDALAVAVWPDQPPQGTGGPAFEVRDGFVTPRVRVEAGHGQLGLLRPARDLVLRPGLPFDRGDGTTVVSDGSDFAFLGIEIPNGVTVTVDASAGPVRLRSCGDVRIDGTLQLEAPARPLPPRRGAPLPIADLIDAAPVSLIAAGDVRVRGAVRTTAVPAEDLSPFLLGAVGDMDLLGELPFRSLLAIEDDGQGAASRIRGARGQTVVCTATFQFGLARGADFEVVAQTSWAPFPGDREAAVLTLRDASVDLHIAWQSVPADPLHRDRPDTGGGRLGRWQPVQHGERVDAGAGQFVRLELRARVTAGHPLPTVRELRLVAR